jgi:4-amino-4-deoxy-L-arabinose transferase-like glycosyltransferase
LPLLGPDEPRYSQVARECSENDWVTPTLGGANWFEKPRCFTAAIASYKLFGVSEFAARFGSAIFGLGTICLCGYWGNQFNVQRSDVQRSTEENEISKNFAKWLALIAASSIGLLVFSRGASFDIILTSRLRLRSSPFSFSTKLKKTRFHFSLSLFTFHFFIGLAMLAKGLIGIVFPLAIVAFYFLLSRKIPNKAFVFSLSGERF